jgi:hypothetical protein
MTLNWQPKVPQALAQIGDFSSPIQATSNKSLQRTFDPPAALLPQSTRRLKRR